MESRSLSGVRFVLGVGLCLLASLLSAAEVNVYSARKENLIKPLLLRFSEQTDIEVNLITGKGRRTAAAYGQRG